VVGGPSGVFVVGVGGGDGARDAARLEHERVALGGRVDEAAAVDAV